MCSSNTIIIMIAAIIAVLVLASGGEGQTANDYRITITGDDTVSFSNAASTFFEVQFGIFSQPFSYIANGNTITINFFFYSKYSTSLLCVFVALSLSVVYRRDRN